MNWDDLRRVLAVARHGSLAAAGRKPGVNSTTVRRRRPRLWQRHLGLELTMVSGLRLLQLVRAGVGIGLIDGFAGDADPGLRRAIAEPVLQSEMWAVVHADMRRTARVRAVIDFLAEIMAQEAGLLEGRRPVKYMRT